MGKRGPKPIDPRQLRLFAELYFWDFKALAYGKSQNKFDSALYEEEVRPLTKLRLNFGERSDIMEKARREFFNGNIHMLDEKTLARDLGVVHLSQKDSKMREAAARKASSKIRRSAASRVLASLLKASTAEEVRKICRRAFREVETEIEPGIYAKASVARWPIEDHSMFPFYLSKHAEQFLLAKLDTRFPRSTRPTSNEKKIWFLSCALAGAVQGIATRTAVNILRSSRPDTPTTPMLDVHPWLHVDPPASSVIPAIDEQMPQKKRRKTS